MLMMGMSQASDRRHPGGQVEPLWSALSWLQHRLARVCARALSLFFLSPSFSCAPDRPHVHRYTDSHSHLYYSDRLYSCGGRCIMKACVIKTVGLVTPDHLWLVTRSNHRPCPHLLAALPVVLTTALQFSSAGAVPFEGQHGTPCLLPRCLSQI